MIIKLILIDTYKIPDIWKISIIYDLTIYRAIRIKFQQISKFLSCTVKILADDKIISKCAYKNKTGNLKIKRSKSKAINVQS